MKKAKVIIKKINKRVYSRWIRWWFRPIWIVLRLIDLLVDLCKKDIIYLSEGDVFVLEEGPTNYLYRVKVKKVRDSFIEVEPLTKGFLGVSHEGVLALGKSLELSEYVYDAGLFIWKLFLKEIIEE